MLLWFVQSLFLAILSIIGVGASPVDGLASEREYTPASRRREDDSTSESECTPSNCRRCQGPATARTLREWKERFYENCEKVSIPKSSQGMERFLNQFHQKCLERQLLLTPWAACIQEKHRPDLPLDDNHRGFVGDFAEFFFHIVTNNTDIGYLFSDGHLTDRAKELIQAEYVNNVALLWTMLYGSSSNPPVEIEDRDGLFTGETFLHIMVVKSVPGMETLLAGIREDIREDRQGEGGHRQGEEKLQLVVEDNFLAEFRGSALLQVVTKRACGLFFQKPNIYRPLWHTKWEKLVDWCGFQVSKKNIFSECSFGELPLCFAAAVGNKAALEALWNAVSAEATQHFPGDSTKQREILFDFLQLTDACCNTPLHMAVLYEQKEVLKFIADKCREHGNWDPFKRLNVDLLSPYTLAVSLGRHGLLDDLEDATTSWSYGRCTHFVINLGQVDSWQCDLRVGRQSDGRDDVTVWLYPLALEKQLKKRLEGTTSEGRTAREKQVLKQWEAKVRAEHGPRVASRWRAARPASALEVAVQMHVRSLSREPRFTRLIRDKWDSYVWNLYTRTAVFPYVLYLIFVTVYINARAAVLKGATNLDDVPADWGWGERVYEPVVILVSTLALLNRAWFHLRMRASDLDTNNDNVVSAAELLSFLFKNLVSVSSVLVVLLMWTAWLSRVAGSSSEIDVLAVLGLAAWLNASLYLIPYQFFGQLLISIHRSIAITMRFLVVIASTLFGFALAMFLLLPGDALDCDDCDGTWMRTVLRYLYASLGEVDLEALLRAPTPWLAVGLHICFIISMPILLLNLLIALLNENYIDEKQERADDWYIEYAATVLRFEGFLQYRLLPCFKFIFGANSRIVHEWRTHWRTGQPQNGYCEIHDNAFP